MSIQSIHYWSSIKHTDYSSPVLRECHHQVNMTTRSPDVENNPGSNQVNIRYIISTVPIDKSCCWIPSALLKSLWHVKISPKEFLYQYFARIPYGSGSWKDFSLGWWNALASAWFPASAILKVWHCGSNFALVYTNVHEKSGTDIRESWPSCPWQYFRSLDCGIVILSVFMAPNRVVLPVSRNKSHWKLLTCFSGAGGPWAVISRTQA